MTSIKAQHIGPRTALPLLPRLKLLDALCVMYERMIDLER